VTFPSPPIPLGTSAIPALPPEPVQFPLGWILEGATGAVQYRALVDVARLEVPKDRYASLALGFPPALGLALAQSTDGTWNGSMLSLPRDGSGLEGVGTILAVRRLLEYGWDRDCPPILHARRVLFRLLAEDDDPAQLYELALEAGDDPDLIHRGRIILREAAAAALAHAGYEGDPRLRGAAIRILDRVDAYLQSPLPQKPWVRVGNRQVLAPEAAPPSLHLLTMLAWMPLFRAEHHARVERLYAAISQPMPRQESHQVVGRHVVAQPHLVLGDPLATRNVADGDVPFAVTWLELMARLQFLRRHVSWLSLYDRFLDDRDRYGVWRPHRTIGTAVSSDPAVWPSMPLDAPIEGADPIADVTFRLGLIARLLGRPITLR
jgi:hypothetical protein